MLVSLTPISQLKCISFTVVEDLYKSREPVPEMKAIYFISPNEKVCSILILQSLCIPFGFKEVKVQLQNNGLIFFFLNLLINLLQ